MNDIDSLPWYGDESRDSRQPIELSIYVLNIQGWYGIDIIKVATWRWLLYKLNKCDNRTILQ